MQAQHEISKLLTEKFAQARLRNPEYSQRAFAHRVGLSSGALTEVFKGKRGLSLQKAEEICDNLDLNPHERENFLTPFFSLPRKGKNTELDHPAHVLPMDQFSLVSDWLHFALLSLVKTKGFKSDSAWISQRLGVSEKEVDACLERLLRLGLLKESGGKLIRAYPNLDTGDHAFSAAIRLAHQQSLDLARESLQKHSTEDRDFTILNFTLDKKRFQRLKKMIRDFQDLAEEEASTKEATEV